MPRPKGNTAENPIRRVHPTPGKGPVPREWILDHYAAGMRIMEMERHTELVYLFAEANRRLSHTAISLIVQAARDAGDPRAEPNGRMVG